ncbi:MAG: hypothetical protein ACRDRN_13190 [Sciscionella sp.]
MDASGLADGAVARSVAGFASTSRSLPARGSMCWSGAVFRVAAHGVVAKPSGQAVPG